MHGHQDPKNLSTDDFITSSIIRFGGLDEYIQEKLMVDYFAIEGNLGVARGLRAYIQNQKSRLEKLKQIRILDVGPAVGAISTLLVLQELGHFKLLDKAKVILLDVSERVIEKTQSRDFQFPSVLVNPTFKSQIYEKLRTSKGVIASSHKMPLKDDHVDICLAGFLFHHLHDKIKKPTAHEMQRVTKPGGFIAVAEEWFNDYDDYAEIHQHDEIPLAFESIISYRKLRRMFNETEIFEAHNPVKRRPQRNDNFYYFCGMKKRPIGSAPRELAKETK